MRKDYEKLFTYLKSAEPSAGLFDRIISTIEREQELRRTKNLLFGLLTISVVSLVAMPFSWTLLVNQVRNSDILYFVSAAVSNLETFLTLWQDFGLAVLESLPITGIIVFTINIILLLFAIRLFLYKKRLLFGYLTHSY